MQLTRIALYHRWRRIRVTSIGYPIMITAVAMIAMAAVCWLSLA